MDTAEIEQRILDLGYLCKREPAFTGMVAVTGQRGRLVCTEKKVEGYGYPAQFWIHQGSNGQWFLGLFAGPVYRVGKSERFLDLISGILNSRRSGARSIEYVEQVKEMYDLIELE